VRSEDDAWDITTSVGSTALFVATARALEAQKPDPLVVDPYAEIFCRAVGGPAANVLDRKDPNHQLKTPDWGAHFVNFQAARTKYFDEYFGRAADAGVRQVVILAAGLDCRAYRLDWPVGTTIFELDRPQVLDFKREVLTGQGAQPRAERRAIAVDLREDWPQALRDNGFDEAKPSAWIAEGLLIYLPGSAQEQLFTGVDSLAAPGSHVVVEDSAPMDPDEFAGAVEEERPRPPKATDGCFSGWSTTSSTRQPSNGSVCAVGRRSAPRRPTPRSRPAGARTGYRSRADDRAQHPGERGQGVSHRGQRARLSGRILRTFDVLAPHWNSCGLPADY
jgi:methyltransferase (TIGR00027 family)